MKAYLQKVIEPKWHFIECNIEHVSWSDYARANVLSKVATFIPLEGAQEVVIKSVEKHTIEAVLGVESYNRWIKEVSTYIL